MVDRHTDLVEFLLLVQLLGDGALKTTVALKFDKLRSESEVDHTERPGIDKFWEVLTRIHGIQEHQRMRSTTSVNQNKRSRDETVNTLNLDTDDKRSPVCFKFQRGPCTAGSRCRFRHVQEPTASKAPPAPPRGKGKGKGKGKSVHWAEQEVKSSVKGSKGLKGQKGQVKGKGKGKGERKGGGKGTRESQPTHCARCELSHHGANGKMCVMPPCRYCLSMRFKSTNHHLKDCRQRPADWEFQPNSSPAKRPQPYLKDNPSPAKHPKVTPDKWLASRPAPSASWPPQRQA